MEAIAKGISVNQNRNKFKIVYLHYTADPDKTRDWAKELQRSYPSLDTWNQEMELDFTKATGRRVYTTFESNLHVKPLEAIPYRTIWRGWDFGFRNPACVWCQITPEGRLHILRELLGKEIVINEFASEVKRLSRKWFPGYSFQDAGDPSVTSRGDKSLRTTASILRAPPFKVRIQSKKVGIDSGIRTIRNLLLSDIEGQVRLKVDKSCTILIDGFLGGYTRNDYDEPVKDGYFEHVFDALRYLVTIGFNPVSFAPTRPSYPYSRKRSTASKTTGY